MLNQAKDSEERSYVVLGFAGWEQIALDGDHVKYYVNTLAESSISIPVILPEVEEPTIT